MSIYAERAFDALGDPTRRAVFARLRAGSRSVGELAAGLDVTRPAVSQHLKVLKKARLVVDRQEGTRRILVNAPQSIAWRVFTEKMEHWWRKRVAYARGARASQAGSLRRAARTDATHLSTAKAIGSSCSSRWAEWPKQRGDFVANIQEARRALVARILEGDGTATHTLRRAAFDNDRLEEPLKTLVRKVVERAPSLTDDDIARARQAGSSEDQIFEVVICAAIGQATRQFEAAFAALEAAAVKG